MKLYENLSALRKSHNYTQEQIAKKLGVARQTVSKWEMGLSEPSLDLLSKNADIYTCTVDELIGRDTVENKQQVDIPEPGYKEPFWTIYKEAFFVFIVGAILTIIYYVSNYFSLYAPSIIVFLAIECPIYIVSAIITVCGDERIKTKSGMIDMILPILLVLIVQIVMGLIIEH